MSEGDALDDYGLEGAVGGADGGGFDSTHDIHPRRDAAEDGVFAVEKIVVGSVDEKLTAIGIRTGICHRDSADDIVIALVQLIIKLIPRIPRAPARHLRIIFCERITALYHEAVDNAVEFGAIVEPCLCELHKIRDRILRIGATKLDGDIAMGGMQNRVHRPIISVRARLR